MGSELYQFFYTRKDNCFCFTYQKNEVITNIDDILIQVDSKTQTFDRYQYFYEALWKFNLKSAPDKTYLFLTAGKCLGHLFTENKIRPLLNKIEAFH